MHFSQANHSENYQFLFLAERETWFFSLPPAHPWGGIRFIRLESLLAWLECEWLAKLTAHANQPFKLQ
jgi:hypothetical protein